MFRILASLAAAAFAFAASSCCCTSDTTAPTLRPVPQFQEVPAADAYTPVVEATK